MSAPTFQKDLYFEKAKSQSHLRGLYYGLSYFLHLHCSRLSSADMAFAASKMAEHVGSDDLVVWQKTRDHYRTLLDMSSRNVLISPTNLLQIWCLLETLYTEEKVSFSNGRAI